MREKKPYIVLTFHTTTEAMAMEKQCNSQEIPGRLIPIPREITAGCGLAWRMNADDYPQYREEINALDLGFDRAVELIL
jgi:hypothetical protein